MVKNFFIPVLLMLGITVSPLNGGDFRKIEIGHDPKIEIGLEFENKYCQIVALNPSAYSGKPSLDDFNHTMPRKDLNDVATVDEAESKLRLFYRPVLRVSTVGGRSLGVPGVKDWRFDTTGGRLRYKRDFSRNNAFLKSEFEVEALPGQAAVLLHVRLKNTGKQTCKVECGSEFIFLKGDLAPLNLMLQREIGRYVNGSRLAYRTNEYTRMTGNYQSYWWRRVVKEQNVFINYHNRERIPFGMQRLVAPEMFGVLGLPGSGALIWDMKESEKLSVLEVSWDAWSGKLTPTWELQLKPREEKNITFRLLTLRGVTAVNALSDNWVFGYKANGDILQIIATPLADQWRIALSATVSDSDKKVIIQQRYEMTASSPFKPGKVEMGATASFLSNHIYPLKLVLNTMPNASDAEAGKQIGAVDGVFIP